MYAIIIILYYILLLFYIVIAGVCYLGGKNQQGILRGVGRDNLKLFSCLYSSSCFNGNYPRLLTVPLYKCLPPHHCPALLGVFHHPFSSPCSSVALAAPWQVTLAGSGVSWGFSCSSSLSVGPGSSKHLHKLQPRKGKSYFSHIRYQVSYGFAG